MIRSPAMIPLNALGNSSSLGSSFSLMKGMWSLFVVWVGRFGVTGS